MGSNEENILLTAEKLFAEKGFSGASTRDISNAAKTNISMISYYFGSKERLFEKVFESRMTEGLSFANKILENPAYNAWEKLSLVVERYVDRVKRLRNFYIILQRQQLANNNPQIAEFLKKSKIEFLGIYDRIIQEGNSQGIFTKEVQAQFIHSLVAGTIFTGINNFSVYQEFFGMSAAEKENYYETLKHNIKHTLKQLLGYEEQN